MLIPDFKVRDIFLTVMIQVLYGKESPNALEKVFFNFLLIFFV
jgi:hypothetical protein